MRKIYIKKDMKNAQNPANPASCSFSRIIVFIRGSQYLLEQMVKIDCRAKYGRFWAFIFVFAFVLFVWYNVVNRRHIKYKGVVYEA